jgi:ubiquinone/menaquinone biosynthesis C-methylase UbiE
MKRIKYQDLIMPTYSLQDIYFYQNIPCFANRTEKDRQNDKYDKDFSFVNQYAALWAFAHLTNNSGYAESLYRTINSIVLTHFAKNGKYNFLDIGCGVGRTEYDLAGLFPNSHFIGLDYAYKMLERANEILFSGKDVEMDLSNDGFGVLTVPGKKLSGNVSLAQADAMNLPFIDNAFDCVFNTFLIDRLSNPQKAITESIRVIRPKGHFIFTNPLNHLTSESWKSLGTFEKVLGLIQSCGIEIIEAFDNLAYKQLLDARGNLRDWQTIVIHGIKH